MKNAILSAFILLTACCFAGEDESEGKSLSFVHVLSDKEDASVPAGKCIVTGIVYYEEQLDPYTYINKPCDSLVSAFYRVGEGKHGRVKRDGSFRVTVDTLEKYMSFTDSDPETDLYEIIYLEHYPFKSGHRVEIAVYLPLKVRQMLIEVDKPVIYAYSDRELDFSLKLKPKGELTFTYPPLPENDTWSMHLDGSGNMTDSQGRSYPYLFWESQQLPQSFASEDLSSDEIIPGSGLLAYLEKSLSGLGFNQQEKTDFITYWCPKMLNHNFVRVQFYLDEQCAVIGDLEINPKPDAIRRVYAIFRGTDEILHDFEPRRSVPASFNREGFIILEWGGSELRSCELVVK